LDTCCLDLSLISLFEADPREPWHCSERVLECSNFHFKNVIKSAEGMRRFHSQGGTGNKAIGLVEGQVYAVS
jgi:hypothetical protein